MIICMFAYARVQIELVLHSVILNNILNMFLLFHYLIPINVYL